MRLLFNLAKMAVTLSLWLQRLRGIVRALVAKESQSLICTKLGHHRRPTASGLMKMRAPFGASLGLAATGAAADALPAALCASAEAPGATLPVAKDEAAASFEAAEDSRRSFLAACGKGMHAANRPAAMWRSGVLIFETAPATASEVSSDSPCASLSSSSALSCSDWCSLFICAADGLRITGRPRSGSFV